MAELPITISQVFDRIREQLNWKGPSGRVQGIVTISREEANYWLNHSIALILERDALVAELAKYPKENVDYVHGAVAAAVHEIIREEVDFEPELR
jgi:hypothetical protein